MFHRQSPMLAALAMTLLLGCGDNDEGRRDASVFPDWVVPPKDIVETDHLRPDRLVSDLVPREVPLFDVSGGDRLTPDTLPDASLLVTLTVDRPVDPLRCPINDLRARLMVDQNVAICPLDIASDRVSGSCPGLLPGRMMHVALSYYTIWLGDELELAVVEDDITTPSDGSTTMALPLEQAPRTRHLDADWDGTDNLFELCIGTDPFDPQDVRQPGPVIILAQRADEHHIDVLTDTYAPPLRNFSTQGFAVLMNTSTPLTITDVVLAEGSQDTLRLTIAEPMWPCNRIDVNYDAAFGTITDSDDPPSGLQAFFDVNANEPPEDLIQPSFQFAAVVDPVTLDVYVVETLCPPLSGLQAGSNSGFVVRADGIDVPVADSTLAPDELTVVRLALGRELHMGEEVTVSYIPDAADITDTSAYMNELVGFDGQVAVNTLAAEEGLAPAFVSARLIAPRVVDVDIEEATSPPLTGIVPASSNGFAIQATSGVIPVVHVQLAPAQTTRLRLFTGADIALAEEALLFYSPANGTLTDSAATPNPLAAMSGEIIDTTFNSGRLFADSFNRQDGSVGNDWQLPLPYPLGWIIQENRLLCTIEDTAEASRMVSPLPFRVRNQAVQVDYLKQAANTFPQIHLRVSPELTGPYYAVVEEYSSQLAIYKRTGLPWDAEAKAVTLWDVAPGSYRFTASALDDEQGRAVVTVRVAPLATPEEVVAEVTWTDGQDPIRTVGLAALSHESGQDTWDNFVLMERNIVVDADGPALIQARLAEPWRIEGVFEDVSLPLRGFDGPSGFGAQVDGADAPVALAYPDPERLDVAWIILTHPVPRGAEVAIFYDPEAGEVTDSSAQNELNRITAFPVAVDLDPPRVQAALAEDRATIRLVVPEASLPLEGLNVGGTGGFAVTVRGSEVPVNSFQPSPEGDGDMLIQILSSMRRGDAVTVSYTPQDTRITDSAAFPNTLDPFTPMLVDTDRPLVATISQGEQSSRALRSSHGRKVFNVPGADRFLVTYLDVPTGRALALPVGRSGAPDGEPFVISEAVEGYVPGTSDPSNRPSGASLGESVMVIYQRGDEVYARTVQGATGQMGAEAPVMSGPGLSDPVICRTGTGLLLAAARGHASVMQSADGTAWTEAGSLAGAGYDITLVCDPLGPVAHVLYNTCEEPCLFYPYITARTWDGAALGAPRVIATQRTDPGAEYAVPLTGAIDLQGRALVVAGSDMYHYLVLAHDGADWIVRPEVAESRTETTSVSVNVQTGTFYLLEVHDDRLYLHTTDDLGLTWQRRALDDSDFLPGGGDEPGRSWPNLAAPNASSMAAMVRNGPEIQFIPLD